MKQLILLFTLLISLYATPPQGVEALSPELRSLLSQEMLALEKGMHSIFSNLIAGDYEKIALKAEKIQNSFILKQKLTPSQRKELQSKLPQAFIQLDQSFHEMAGELLNAAEFEDEEASVKLYSKMSRTCIQCHSTYAQERFPSFQEQ